MRVLPVDAAFFLAMAGLRVVCDEDNAATV
jgi:hypothetical protein